MRKLWIIAALQTVSRKLGLPLRVRWALDKWKLDATRVSLAFLLVTTLASYAASSGTIVVTAQPAEAGTTTGSGTYRDKTKVVISATANPGWGFSRWHDGNLNATRTVTVRRGTKTWTATLTNVNSYGNLMTGSEPPNGGTVSGAGTYKVGSSAQIWATPAPYWSFVRWQDHLTANPRVVTIVEGTLTMVGTFQTNAVPYGALTAIAIPPQGGTIDGQGSYPVGEAVTLKAAPNVGWRFDHWQDGTTSASRDFVVQAEGFTATATFTQFGTITLSSEPPQGGTTAGAGSYPVGQTVTVSASPAAGWKFKSWQDGNANQYRTIVVPGGTLLLVATFTATASTNAPGASINWAPSATTNVTRYVFSWGVAPGYYTNSVETAGTSIWLPLKTNVTYYASVMAFNEARIASVPSCEVQWRWGLSNFCGIP